MALSKLKSLVSGRIRAGNHAMELAANEPMLPENERSVAGALDIEGYVEAENLRAAGEEDALTSSIKPHAFYASKRVEIFGISIPKALLWLLLLPAGIVLLSFLLPSNRRHSPTELALLNNGTHDFHPTTLVVSLDGFRELYLSSHANLVPNILSIGNAGNGLRAKTLQPQWPTLTFPNHWSMMTGLHVETHGIVANHFYDPEQGVQFKIEEAEMIGESQWWRGEPMWSVAEKAGLITANMMWPGPPATSQGVAPTYAVPFGDMDPSAKVDQLLTWIDMPIEKRPRLIFGYMPEVDQFGHLGGPNSVDVEKALQMVDQAIGRLLNGLKERNLENIVNLIVLSDHGMSETSNDRMIFLDDVLGKEGFEAIQWRDGWPSAGLRFKEGTDTGPLLENLQNAAIASQGSFTVHTRETMPERWSYNASDRIAPIWAIPKLGWVLVDHHEFEDVLHGQFTPKGLHGYDNTEAEMQAMFFAQGPFVDDMKVRAMQSGSEGWVSKDPHVIDSFNNLEIFTLVLGLVGLSDKIPAHNGTIGFWKQYL
ncbi:alkaline-phosphatase-like protein [Kockovaella imperatae]|uniref:Alkaline-phosphatase-like protein n=1 Tax=Kockovaella imperatae TaxID=4999 RepID=A0A1Y1UBQ9_9TREE|nr:alkaline-phosphatase-like protein [Kockovaella imperatae]ORX35480.1 alkaline-phosphatase-like protein [Kockovaella imperatae]